MNFISQGLNSVVHLPIYIYKVMYIIFLQVPLEILKLPHVKNFYAFNASYVLCVFLYPPKLSLIKGTSIDIFRNFEDSYWVD